MTGTSDVARVDPGPVTKIFLLRADGTLRSPVVTQAVWQSPILRAHHFSGDSQVAEAPGIHAWRFGWLAAPERWDIVLALCRIPPGTRAVMSPWAVRAEALLVERLVVHPTVPQSAIWCRLRDMWARHCEITVRAPDGYYATNDPVLGFRLLSHGHIWAQAGYISWAQPLRRGVTVTADPDAIVCVERYSRDRWPREAHGAHVGRALARWMLRVYRHADPCLRDILTPWLRYATYVR